jgi:hypothetical protein
MAGMGVVAALVAPAAALARVPDTRPRETRALERAKERADRALPQASRKPAAAPRTQTFSPAFDGIAAGSNADWAGFTPPDPTGSVGVDDYVQIVNSMIAVYKKSDQSSLMSPTDLQSFYRSNGLPALRPGVSREDPGDSVFDVQVQWDSASGRWLIASADIEPPPDSTHPGLAALIYGWSKSDDPTGGWCMYRTTPGQTFEDFPKLGHDGTHLMIGTNEFADSSESSMFMGAKLWTVQTPPPGTLSTCDPTTLNGPQPVNGAFTPVPANIADATSSTTTGYVVATSGAGTSSSLRLYTVNSSGVVSASGTPIAVNTFSQPPNVQQPGTTDVLDSADGRLTQAVAVGGRIWTQHTVSSADGQRAEVRWYELDGPTKTKVQEGAITDLSNSVFNASISPTADGHDAAIQYNVGGRFHLVELRAQTRRDTVDPLGTMENELTIGPASSAIDQDFSCDGPSCRWGDYSGASPDPSNTDVVWGTNQLNGPIQGTAPSWVTRNFALQFGGPDPAPTATVDGFPFTSSSSTPAFNFASSETGSTFQCSLNAGAFAPCTPGHTFGPALANGTYTFAVIATDATGQQSAPAQGTFTVAAPLPDTIIDSGPPSSGTSRSASFSFHSTKPGSTFQCSFDGGAFAACTSPFTRTHLAPAQHAFAVRASDPLGNLELTPATSSFKVVLASASASVRSQRAGKKGTVAVRVRCPAAREVACRGSVTLKAGRTMLASERFRVAAGRTTTLHVKLTRKARKLLQKKKRLRVKATIRFSSPAKRTTRTFILRRR